MRLTAFVRFSRRLFVLAGLVLCLWLPCGCSREEQAEEPEPASVSVSRLDDAVGTRALLERMPATAAVALATPSLSGPYSAALGLWERAAAAPGAVREDVLASAQAWATAWGVLVGARDHLDVLRAVGIDVDSPAAAFFGAEALAAWAESTENSREAFDEPGHREGGVPAVAVLLRCADPAHAERELERLAALAFGRTVTPVPVETDGIPMMQLSPMPYWYTFEEDRLILGGDSEFVAAVVRRRVHPASVRYGTSEYPARSDGEIVALAHMTHLHTLDDALTARGLGLGFIGGLLLDQILFTESGQAGNMSGDPLVMTLVIDADRVALESRLDTQQHPRVLQLAGSPPQLTYPALVPASAKGFLALGATPQWKTRLIESIRNSSPEEPTAALLAETLLGAVGEEAALAVMGIRDGLPISALMLDITQPDLFKGMLRLAGIQLVPVDGAVNGLMRLEAPMELPVPIFGSLGEQHLFLATDTGLLGEILGRQESGATDGGYLAQVSAPIDPAVPRYLLLMLGESAVSDVLAPLLVEPGAEPDYLSALSSMREFRVFQELDDSWLTTRMELQLQ